LAARGEPAGAFDEIALDPVTVELRAGDILVLYTDGVTDATGSSGRFGAGRLERALSGASSARDAAQRIEAALRAFQVGEPRDDTAILAMMRT
jgi:sigma-B regulation protein RsbU (phosphoserine phosphatase)